MTKEKRMTVYNKFDGHCAYCGVKLKYKELQVDHIKAQHKMRNQKRKVIDDIDNLYPSCRQCNWYKRINSIKVFRKLIATMHIRLEKVFIYKLAKKYGIVKESKWNGKFYFETYKKDEKK